jgi:hypothetical protein
MGVSDEAKNVIPLKFLRKIKNNFFFPLVNSIRGHTVRIYHLHITDLEQEKWYLFEIAAL